MFREKYIFWKQTQLNRVETNLNYEFIQKNSFYESKATLYATYVVADIDKNSEFISIMICPKF